MSILSPIISRIVRLALKKPEVRNAAVLLAELLIYLVPVWLILIVTGSAQFLKEATLVLSTYTVFNAVIRDSRLPAKPKVVLAISLAAAVLAYCGWRFFSMLLSGVWGPLIA